MKATFITLTGIASIALVSCENPADKTTSAKTGEAQAVPVGDVTGQKWVFSEDSSISFIGSKVTGSHEGGFKEFTGFFHVNGDQLAESGHQIVITMDSTWSDAEKLTGHLKSADFFDVEKYPQTTFVATGVRKSEASEKGTHQLSGNLNLHGVEKSIEFPVTVEQSEEQIHLTAEFDINRFDFDIKYPGKQDDLIREEVVIKFDLKAKPEVN